MKSSPFTHTGVLASYPLAEYVTLYSGSVTGADNFNRDFGAWSFLGGFSWNAGNGESGLQFSLLNGDASESLNDNCTYLSAEWFRDQQGFRYTAGKAGYYAISLDLNWKPLPCLMLRPELRYDRADLALSAYV